MSEVPGPSVDTGIGRPRKRKIRPAPLTITHLTTIQKFMLEVELYFCGTCDFSHGDLSDFLEHVRTHAESPESDTALSETEDLFSEEVSAAPLYGNDQETLVQDDIIDSLAASIPPDLDLGQLDENILDIVLPPSNHDLKGESDSTFTGRRPHLDHAVDDESENELLLVTSNIVREKSKTENGKVTKTVLSGKGPMPKSRKGRPKSVQIEEEEKVSKTGSYGNGPMPKSRKSRPKSVRIKEEESSDNEVESVPEPENGLNPKARRGRPKSVLNKEDDGLAEVNEAGKSSNTSRNNNESDYSRKYKPRHRKPLDGEEQNGSDRGIIRNRRSRSQESDESFTQTNGFVTTSDKKRCRPLSRKPVREQHSEDQQEELEDEDLPILRKQPKVLIECSSNDLKLNKRNLKASNDFPKLLLHKLSEEEIMKYLSASKNSAENGEEEHPRYRLKRRASTVSSKGYSDGTDYSYEADSSDESDDSGNLIIPAKRAKREIRHKTTSFPSSHLSNGRCGRGSSAAKNGKTGIRRLSIVNYEETSSKEDSSGDNNDVVKVTSIRPPLKKMIRDDNNPKIICKKNQDFAESSRCSYKSSSSRKNDFFSPRDVPSTSFLSTADIVREFRKYENREMKVILTGFKCRLCDTFRASLKQSLDFHVKNEHSSDKHFEPSICDQNNVTSIGNGHRSEKSSDTSLLGLTSPLNSDKLNDVSLPMTSLANGRAEKIYDPVVISIQKLVQVKKQALD